ncbi:MAG TPA: hypothetical protein VE130_11420 [Nitrososphaeraceae archaeon]|nr:hypothetical protein [Nitrososphaeraceae archaeon]
MIIIGIELILQFIFSGLLLQSEFFDGIERTIQAATGIFSILLLALSISAYRRTGLKKIIFAAVAFALFAVQLLIESLEDTFEVLDTGYGSVLTSAMTLAILVLFFMAIVQKK